MFLKEAGWHEMPDGQRVTYEGYITWDPGARKFRSYYFSDWGELGEGSWKISPDGRTIDVAAESVRANGQKVRGRGRMTFTDDDTLNWTWTEHSGLFQKMEFKGTSKRQP